MRRNIVWFCICYGNINRGKTCIRSYIHDRQCSNFTWVISKLIPANACFELEIWRCVDSDLKWNRCWQLSFDSILMLANKGMSSYGFNPQGFASKGNYNSKTSWVIDIYRLVTQTTPEPTLLIWGGWPREKNLSTPGHAAKPSLIALIRPLRHHCSWTLWCHPLILRCTMNAKFT